MMLQVSGHLIMGQSFQMTPSHHSGGDGPGGMVHEFIQQVILACKDKGEEGLGVVVELAQGLELSQDFQAQEIRFVDNKQGCLFSLRDFTDEGADCFGDSRDGVGVGLLVQSVGDLPQDLQSGACGGDDRDEFILGGVEFGGEEAQGGGFTSPHFACHHTHRSQLDGEKTAFGCGLESWGVEELIGGDILGKRFLGETKVGFIVRHRSLQKVSRSGSDLKSLQVVFPPLWGRSGWSDDP